MGFEIESLGTLGGLARPGKQNIVRTVKVQFVTGKPLVRMLRTTINEAARRYKIWPDVVCAIIAHESGAMERELLNYAGSADMGERVQVLFQGDTASIGIAQMRVGLASKLRTKYPDLKQAYFVTEDLLDKEVAVYYAAAALRGLSDKVHAFMREHGVSLQVRQLQDLTALGYNIGWDNLRNRNLLAPDMGEDVLSRVNSIRRKSNYIRLTMTAWRN